LAHILRKKNFNLVIDLQNNRKSHILSALTLALDRYGYDNRKFGFLLNHRIKDEGPFMDPLTHQFRILKMLGIDLPRPSFNAIGDSKEGRGLGTSSLELWPAQEDEHYIDELLNSEWVSPNQIIVGINISASQRWVTKNWPLHHTARLCEELARRDMRIVITGTENELPEANKLAGMLKNVKLINACAKTTINQLACLIKRCTVYISPDSASLHIAASVSVPFVALFGPTDPRRHLAPARKYIVIKKPLPCSPCYKSKCKSKKCMERIAPKEVLEAIDELLK
jgi:ADP-heptose:LPS heptosyltransferase